MPADTSSQLLFPHWPAKKHIHAYSTLRYPGHSTGAYAAFNLAMHVGDDSERVLCNRRDLMHHGNLPNQPVWLNQIHSNIAIKADTVDPEEVITADASYTTKLNTVCVVMTADCLPVLVTNQEGTEIAALHAGWQGLAKGIIENTLSALSSPPESLLIWIGPSIQQNSYEVSEDFYAAFACHHNTLEMSDAFHPTEKDKWLANVPLLAVQRLIRYGILRRNIYLSSECTYTQSEKYFSFRRDGVTGRMASLIFITG